MKKLNFLFLSDVYETGGVETYIESFSPILKKNGHSYSIVYFCTHEKKHHSACHPLVINKIGLAKHLTRLIKINHFLFAYHGSATNYVMVYNTSLIFFYSLPFLIYQKLMGDSKKIIFQFHGSITQEWISSLPTTDFTWQTTLHYRFKQKLLRLSEKVTYSLADKIIVFSQYSEKMLLSQHLPRNKVVLIKPGLTLPTLKFQSLTQVRTQLGLDHKSKVVLAVSRIERRKGVYQMLEIFNKMDALLSNAVFIYCSNFNQDLEETARFFSHLSQLSLKNSFYCVHSPSRKQLSLYFHAANLFLQPAIELETFGFTTLEAFQAGTPVGGFNIGANSELIMPGLNGYLRAKNQINLLVSDIVTHLKTPLTHHPMAKAAKRTSQQYSWQTYYRQFMATVAELESYSYKESKSD